MNNLSNNFTPEVIKIMIYTLLSFCIAYWWAPKMITLLRWLKFWKKKSRSSDMSGNNFQYTKKFYEKDESHMQIPRAGGLIIWIVPLVIMFSFWFLFKLDPDNQTLQFLNFVDSRSTFIPIAALFFSAILGFVDDTLATMETGGNYHAGGLKLRQRIMVIAFVGFLAGLWFHFKLTDKISGQNFLHKMSIAGFSVDLTKFSPSFTIPFVNLLIPAGWLLIIIAMITVLSCWAGSVIDGFDGLAAGCFIPLYVAFAGIAIHDGQYRMATFIMVIAGAMVAYLAFNIAPAKVYMGDTGSTAVLVTIAIIAILLNRVWLLPLAAIMMYVTMTSNVIQITSKKLFKRKVFLAAPIHHHFEAMGIPRHIIVYSYWAVSIVCSSVALALGILVK